MLCWFLNRVNNLYVLGSMDCGTEDEDGINFFNTRWQNIICFSMKIHCSGFSVEWFYSEFMILCASVFSHIADTHTHTHS